MRSYFVSSALAVPVFAAMACTAFAETSGVAPDPAALRIAAAQKAIDQNPAAWQPHIDLAVELCRKARDSEQIDYYNRAAAEIRRALKLSPGNYEARKVDVEILAGKHEFAAALEAASALNHKIPDDIAVWGLLAEINGALGSYAEALRDAQWVLDIRPGSTLGFTEAARLREVHGDLAGAIEFYEEALRRTSFGDLEERAWLLTQTARLTVQSGDAKRAETLFGEALKINPESQLAIAGLAKARIAAGDCSNAIAPLDKRDAAVHSARSAYDLAESLERCGHESEAATAFQRFESMAKAAVELPDNANMELIYYYADRKPDRAATLALAEREHTIRHDSATLAAWAWALYVNARYADARTRMDEALATGARNPVWFCHAARIAADINDPQAAVKYEKEAVSAGSGGCAIGHSSSLTPAAAATK